MKNLKINKDKIISLLLSGSLVLSGFFAIREIKEKKSEIPEVTPTPLPISDEITYDESTLFYRKLLYGYKYEPIDGSKDYILHYGDILYFLTDGILSNKYVTCEELNVTLISSQGDYAQIMLPEGDTCYVSIQALQLASCDNIKNGDYTVIEENKERVVRNNTFLYNHNGIVISHLCAEEPCTIVATSSEYAFITLPDGSSGFVLGNTLVNNYEYINGYTFVNQGTNLYYGNDFTNIAYTVTDDVQMLYVDCINQEYALVYDRGGAEAMYIRLADLREDFIYQDLANQRMYCFKNYQLAAVFPTRSGKLVSPTHEGVFSITEKAEDFSFSKYPGCHAKHWIVYNEEDEEGIHDLVGDDEENYGNQAYQLDGSHGCIRVPANASEFIYENYDIGDMVIVAHDNQMLIYNIAKNEIGIYNTDDSSKTRSK